MKSDNGKKDDLVRGFAVNTERLVSPMKVGKVHYLQTRLRRLPRCLQKMIIKSATKKAPRMPFVVEPYALFLFYEIPEPERVQKFLPEGFELAEFRIFDGDEPKYYGIVSNFRVHTSVFWGARTEFYLVAKNTKTGLLSWVIMDYMSDTISYDEKSGLRSPDVEGGVMTTTCEGEVVVEMKTVDGAKLAKATASLRNAKMRPLDQTLWIEGNTSIAYGRRVGEADADLFSLTFLPEEMKQALDVPLADVREVKAYTKSARLGAELARVVCFPYAQHMLSDAPGHTTHYGSEEELRKAAEGVKWGEVRG